MMGPQLGFSCSTCELQHLLRGICVIHNHIVWEPQYKVRTVRNAWSEIALDKQQEATEILIIQQNMH